MLYESKVEGRSPIERAVAHSERAAGDPSLFILPLVLSGKSTPSLHF